MTVRLENTVQDMEQPVPVNDAIALLLALDGANATQPQRRGYNVPVSGYTTKRPRSRSWPKWQRHSKTMLKPTLRGSKPLSYLGLDFCENSQPCYCAAGWIQSDIFVGRFI
jgi:hypothetical protein